MDNVHYAIAYNTGFRPQGGQISTHYTIYSEEGQLLSTDYIRYKTGFRPQGRAYCKTLHYIYRRGNCYRQLHKAG